ncbi:integrating conjugative element protein [Proteus mirabilis]|uniref:integrating conjugative element protein n=1 Tax=Proteus mirabilis TaxID=584 RepID=UPI0036CDC6C4
MPNNSEEKTKLPFYSLTCGGLMLFCVVGGSQAALTMVADHGGQPAAPFYDAINNTPNEWTSPPVTRTQPSVMAPSMVLPVETPEMTPGEVDDRVLHLPGIGALYLVGDDPLSREWLTQHASRLNAMNAAGMVVNVKSEAGLHALQALARGGLLSPASGSDLAVRLQLSHYPVLITETGLTQQVK